MWWKGRRQISGVSGVRCLRCVRLHYNTVPGRFYERGSWSGIVIPHLFLLVGEGARTAVLLLRGNFLTHHVHMHQHEIRSTTSNILLALLSVLLRACHFLYFYIFLFSRQKLRGKSHRVLLAEDVLPTHRTTYTCSTTSQKAQGTLLKDERTKLGHVGFTQKLQKYDIE